MHAAGELLHLRDTFSREARDSQLLCQITSWTSAVRPFGAMRAAAAPFGGCIAELRLQSSSSSSAYHADRSIAGVPPGRWLTRLAQSTEMRAAGCMSVARDRTLTASLENALLLRLRVVRPTQPSLAADSRTHRG